MLNDNDDGVGDGGLRASMASFLVVSLDDENEGHGSKRWFPCH